MTYNTALTTIRFPCENFKKFKLIHKFDRIFYISNEKELSLGEIVDIRHHDNYYVFDIEVRKDETPLWYLLKIIDGAKMKSICVEGFSQEEEIIDITNGTIISELINGGKVSNSNLPKESIVSHIQYKLIPD